MMKHRRLVLGAAAALVAVGLASGPDVHAAKPSSRNAERNAARDDVPGTPVELRAAASTSAVGLALDIEGETRTLDLAVHSVRSPLYRVERVGADGTHEEVAPGPVRTYRGAIRGEPGSLVAAGRIGNGWAMLIERGDGRRFWLDHEGEGHVLRAQADLPALGAGCATIADRAAIEDEHRGPERAATAVSAEGASGHYTAELACDADSDFTADWGAATEDRINAVINAMNVQYERDVAISHEITTIVVHVGQVYTATDPETLLDEFRDHWIAVHNDVPRDVTQLFTGKELDGNVVGIATSLGEICTNQAYCLVQSDYNGIFGCATDLSAHELGHLWDAAHCTCPSHTMNPQITCSNEFSAVSIASILAHRDSRWCLDVPPTSYCFAESQSAAFEYIARVEIGEIDNASGASTYTSYVGQSATLARGTSATLTVTLGFGYVGDVGGAWVDWNDDFELDDPGEIITVDWSGSGPYVATVDVPEDAPLGPTRLRVRIQDGVADPDPVSCGASSFGEVEDYTIEVVAAPCPPDLDGDGSVGFLDLLEILSVWGPCPGCPEDLDGDGTAGFLDLLEILSVWGPCM